MIDSLIDCYRDSYIDSYEKSKASLLQGRNVVLQWDGKSIEDALHGLKLSSFFITSPIDDALDMLTTGKLPSEEHLLFCDDFIEVSTDSWLKIVHIKDIFSATSEETVYKKINVTIRLIDNPLSKERKEFEELLYDVEQIYKHCLTECLKEVRNLLVKDYLKFQDENKVIKTADILGFKVFNTGFIEKDLFLSFRGTPAYKFSYDSQKIRELIHFTRRQNHLKPDVLTQIQSIIK